MGKSKTIPNRYPLSPCSFFAAHVSFFLLGTLRKEGETCGPLNGECAPGLYCDISMQWGPDSPGHCRPTNHEDGFPDYSDEWNNYNY